MRYFKIIFLLILSSFIYSCGAVKEGFSNQKKDSSDEFLVEKKSPLVLPPDYNELPTPKSNQESEKKNQIKKLVTNSNNVKETKKKVDENFEKSILKKIKNN
tara:strand:- start:3797 stop:4102 length:306 start_codon:yes stop_codon:yes gene_type:complete